MDDHPHKKLKHYNYRGHAHELTFSCYRRQDHLRDPVACDLLLDEMEHARQELRFRIWASAFAKATA